MATKSLIRKRGGGISATALNVPYYPRGYTNRIRPVGEPMVRRPTSPPDIATIPAPRSPPPVFAPPRITPTSTREYGKGYASVRGYQAGGSVEDALGAQGMGISLGAPSAPIGARGGISPTPGVPYLEDILREQEKERQRRGYQAGGPVEMPPQPPLPPLSARVGPKLLRPGASVAFRVGPKLLTPGAPVGFRVGPYGPTEPDDD